MAEPQQGAEVFNNLQQFLQHALDCSNPSCILPLCVNTKLTLEHSQECNKSKCAICQEMKSLASRHSESCVDRHCRIPFCMEAKLDTHNKRTQMLIDLNDCLDVILKDNENAEGHREIERVSTVTTARQQRCLESLRKSQDGEITSGQTGTAPNSPSLFKPVDTHSPAASSTVVNPYSATFFKASSPAKFPRLILDQDRGQASINATTDTNDSSWCGFMEPFSASQDSTFTAMSQERATSQSSVEEIKARENATTNHQVMIDLSSTFPPTRQQNDEGLQISQSSNKDMQGTMVANVYQNYSTPQAIGLVDGSVARDKEAKNTQTLLKVRLFDALYCILRLIKHTKSAEELLMCITSLKSALYQVKKSKII